MRVDGEKLISVTVEVLEDSRGRGDKFAVEVSKVPHVNGYHEVVTIAHPHYAVDCVDALCGVRPHTFQLARRHALYANPGRCVLVLVWVTKPVHSVEVGAGAGVIVGIKP